MKRGLGERDVHKDYFGREPKILTNTHSGKLGMYMAEAEKEKYREKKEKYITR